MHLPGKRIESVHLQLTRKCNLRCYFCGQWGRKGFFAGDSNSDMMYEEWRNVICSLMKYRNATGISPNITLWGGEPLMYSEFREVVEFLTANKFHLQLITNGVLIDKFPDLIRNSFKTVFISVDGPREIHDRIRGDGVFDKVSANIELLKGGNARIVLLTTISQDNVDIMTKIPHMLQPLGADKIILQKLIFLSSDECAAYGKWLKSAFAMDATSIGAWAKDDAGDYLDKYEKNIRALQCEIQSNSYSIQVEYLQHGADVAAKFCMAPFRRLHVAYNGDVLYCTDFYDFKAGNVRKNDLVEIFSNGISEKFRHEVAAGNCPTCRHCSWKNKENYSCLES